MTTTKAKPIAIGTMECGYCGQPVAVKIAKGGHVTATCDHTQGGCGYQHHGRAGKNDELVLARITTWQDNDAARALRAKVKGIPAPSPRRPSSNPPKKPASSISRNSSASTTPEAEPDTLTKFMRGLGLE